MGVGREIEDKLDAGGASPRQGQWGSSERGSETACQLLEGGRSWDERMRGWKEKRKERDAGRISGKYVRRK